MSSHAQALQRAIFATLAAQAELIALIGPEGLSDHARIGTQTRGILIGGIESRSFGTMTETGEEHLVTLEIWSFDEGHRTVETIAGLVAASLGPELVLDGGITLVDLVWQSTLVSHGADASRHRALMRFRAITE